MNTRALHQLRIVCPACGTVNGTNPLREQLIARCGKCSAPLFAGKPVDIQAQTFDLHTGKSDIPVLVDIWAPWCGPCRAMGPAFAEAAKELEPAVRLVKLNADEAQDICARYAIKGIPALLLFHRGTLVAQTAGAMDARRLVSWTRNSLSNMKE